MLKQIVSQADQLMRYPGGYSVALGMFDGVHLGHQRLLEVVIGEAQAAGSIPVAITFEPHPQSVLQPERAPLRIQTPEHKLKTLGGLGIGAILVHSFDREFAQLTGEAYLRGLAASVHPLRHVCVGQGFHFGHQRSGDTPLIERLGEELGFEVQVVPPVVLEDDLVSSSRIRQRIRVGDLNTVDRLLGRSYELESVVVAGDRLGRRIGFPTANLQVEGLELPPFGVYAAWIGWKGERIAGVLNLGVRPTLQQPGPQRRLEIHLFDFDGDLYGETLCVTWVKRLRTEQRFADLSSLKHQIGLDILMAREVLGQNTPTEQPVSWHTTNP